ncbi:MAG: hypothetical protein R3B09_09085 [Nannocystaceae bacterium]
MTRLQLPRLGALEVAWLWLSFQRYALLLGLLAAAPLALALALGGGPWALALAGLVGLPIAARALAVARRGPAKLHAYRVALHRIGRGAFEPADVRRHCGDPCFRVVARTSLRRAGIAAAERRRLIAGYARELADERSAVIVIDHRSGQVTQTIGGVTTTAAIAGLPSGPAIAITPAAAITPAMSIAIDPAPAP